MKSSTVIVGVLSALILIVPGIGQSDSTVNLMSDSESLFADSMIASLNDVNPDAANNDNNVTANNLTAPDPEFVDVSTVDVSEIFEEVDMAEEVDVAEVEAVAVTPETEVNVTAPAPVFLDVSTIDVSGIFSEMISEEADVAEEVDVAEVEPAPAADDETFPELIDRRVLVTSSIADFLEIPYVVERPYTRGQMMS